MEKYVCKVCGSENIQIRQWVNPNSNEMFEWVDDENYRECWCEDCNDISEWEMKEP